MAIDVEDIGLLKNFRFRRLLESRVLGQAAWNAMIYGLLILVVEQSGSSVQSTFLIVAMTLPSILFGIPGGALADMFPLRFSLTAGYLLRAVVAAALIYYRDDLSYIYILVFAASCVGQVFTPAEAATVPAVVRRDQLSSANSLMILTMIMGQIIGAVTLAPILLKLLGPAAVFTVCMLFFLAATYVIGWMASGYGSSKVEEDRPKMGVIEAMREGFRILSTKRHAYLAIIYLVTATTMSKMLIILMPKYVEDVLKIAPEDTVFVAAPAAIGAALGLVLAPPLSRWLGAWRVVAIGFAVLMAGLMGLGLVVFVRDFIQDNLDFGITFVEEEVGVSSVITVTMLLAMPVGFAFTLVAVAARVVMNEQAPQEVQGRVFAVQMAVGDFFSLMPLLLVGVVADVVGVRATLLAASMSAIAVASYLTFSTRFGPSTRPPPAPVEAPQIG